MIDFTAPIRSWRLPLALVLLFMMTSGATASADHVPVPSALRLLEGGVTTVRDPIEITVQLTDDTGATPGAVDNEALEFYLDQKRVRRTRTDENGIATFTVREEFPAGVYTAHVLYNGSKSLRPAVLSAEIVVNPAELVIYTVPPLEGVAFELDGEQFLTDHAGIATTEVDRLGTYQLSVLPHDSGSRQIRFNRWVDEVFTSTREIDIKRVRTLEVGFNTSYRVTTEFFDLDGLTVDPDRIERVVLRSSHGTESVLVTPEIGTEKTGAIWLQAGRVVRRFHGLEETPILWSIERVEIDGTNVVNRAQQRFFLSEEDYWPIELLLYEARFTARDALFGFPLGDGINLEFPNGHAQEIEFVSGAHVTVESLPRGQYRVNVAGAPGYSPYAPVALSRDQDVHLLVVSYLDIGVAITLLTMLALGLVFVGRPSLLRFARVSERGGGIRRVLIGVCAVALVLGVSVLSFGGRAESTQSPSLRPDSAPPLSEFQTRAPENFTTGDPFEPVVATKSDPKAIVDDFYLDALHHWRAPEISELFEQFWAANGGYAVFGKPLSRAEKWTFDERDEVLIIQRFEHATLEYRAQADGSNPSIQLRRLGSHQAEANDLLSTEPFRPVPENARSSDECRYYRQTSHFVCGEFLNHWSSYGLEYGQQTGPFRKSVQLLGYPISEAFEDPESGRMIQYFERAVLEAFPEFAETPHFIQRANTGGQQS